MSKIDDRLLLVSYNLYDTNKEEIVTKNRILSQSDLAHFIHDSMHENYGHHFWNNLRVDYMEGLQIDQLEAVRFLRDVRNALDEEEMKLISEDEMSVANTIDRLLYKFSQCSLGTLEVTRKLAEMDLDMENFTGS